MTEEQRQEQNRRANTALDAIKPEFPNQGVTLVVTHDLNTQTVTTNIDPHLAAGALRTAADLLDQIAAERAKNA